MRIILKKLSKVTLTSIIFSIHILSSTFPMAQAAQQPEQTSAVAAQVRRGQDLCDAEKAALAQRIEINRAALSTLTGQELSTAQTPVIAIAASGGGVRASIAHTAFLNGLAQIGVLRAVTYNAALSGSTWSTAAAHYHQMDPATLKQYIKTKVSDPLSTINKEAILKALYEKHEIRKTSSFNDLWGALIANIYLGTATNNGAQDVRLTSIAPQVSSGAMPIPIFTTIFGDTDPLYKQAEYTPFEFGSCFQEAWIPAQAVGKIFENGKSVDEKPEETFGFLLGMSSSAWAASPEDLVQDIFSESLEEHHFWERSLIWLAKELGFLDSRVSKPTINNLAFALADCPLSDKAQVSFVDAGLNFNIPIPPLLSTNPQRRNARVIFVCDASSDAESTIGLEMRKVADYARQNGIPFPSIDFDILAKKQLSVWTDANPAAPIIIYVPNTHAFSTEKFSYTEAEFNAITDEIESAILSNKELIYSALKAAVTKVG